VLTFLDQYREYCTLSLKKHEEPYSFKRWLKELCSIAPNCTKCNRARKTLLEKMKDDENKTSKRRTKS
jgi:hypothetical protein